MSDRLAKAILLAAGGVAALVLFRLLRLIGRLWEHHASAPVVREVAVVTGCLAVAMALPLAALRLAPALRVNVALALVSASTGAYIVELWLALHSASSELGLREKLQAVEELRRRGVDAYPGIAPSRFVWSRDPGGPSWILADGMPALPLGGIALRPIVQCKEVDTAEFLTYRNDEHGFHNPAGLWGSVPLDVAAVGDSFTEGLCVPSEENMVARIRRRYPATVNLGRAGSGPLLMLALLREYLPGLRPKVVVWCYFSGNDLLDLRRERTHPILIRYLEDGFRQGLLERQDALDRALEAYLKAYHVPALVRRSKAWPRAVDVLALRNLRARLGLSFADPYATVPTEDEYRLFEQVLAKAKATVTAWGGRMYFVCLPGWTELPSQIGEGAQAELEPKVQQRVLALARGLGLTVIDVRSAFAAHPAPESLFACRKCHYNAEGYRVAADAILRALEPAAQP